MLKFKLIRSILILLSVISYSPTLLSQANCISLFDSRPLGLTQVLIEKGAITNWLKANYFRLLKTDFKSNSHSQNLLLTHEILIHAGFKVGRTIVTHVNENAILVTKDYQRKNLQYPNQKYSVRTQAQFFYSSLASEKFPVSLRMQYANFVVFGIHDQKTKLESILDSAQELQSRFHFEVQAKGYQPHSDRSMAWANYQKKIFYEMILPLALQDPSIWELRIGRRFGRKQAEAPSKTSDLPGIFIYRNLPIRLVVPGSVAPVHLFPIEYGETSNFAGVMVTSDWMTKNQVESVFTSRNRSQYLIVIDELTDPSRPGIAIAFHRETGKQTELKYNPETGIYSMLP